MDDFFVTPEEEHSKFKANGYGKWITASLFFEFCSADNKEIAMYTLRDMDIKRGGKTYKSAKLRYLAMEDVTEYEFANKYFGGWDHWKEMCNSPKVGPHIEKWREELTLKLRARGMKAIIEKADGERGTDAAKYLIEKGWEKKRGRPSKQERAQRAKEDAELQKRTSADLERIGLKAVK